jgi:hypothetical protein
MMTRRSNGVIEKENGNKKPMNGQTSNNTKSRDRKFAFTTVALNFIFLILNLPIAVYGQLTTSLEPNLDLILTFIFEILWYLYYASGFYVQIIVNSTFRNELFALFKLQPMKRNGAGVLEGSINTLMDIHEYDRENDVY